MPDGKFKKIYVKSKTPKTKLRHECRYCPEQFEHYEDKQAHEAKHEKQIFGVGGSE